MHTVRMIVVGLVLLGVFIGAARLANDPDRFPRARAARLFLPVWLLASIANLFVGMVVAGVPFLTELAVLIAVFGVPAAAALLVARHRSG